jgi:hypothetical protein
VKVLLCSVSAVLYGRIVISISMRDAKLISTGV